MSIVRDDALSARSMTGIEERQRKMIAAPSDFQAFVDREEPKVLGGVPRSNRNTDGLPCSIFPTRRLKMERPVSFKALAAILMRHQLRRADRTPQRSILSPYRLCNTFKSRRRRDAQPIRELPRLSNRRQYRGPGRSVSCGCCGWFLAIGEACRNESTVVLASRGNSAETAALHKLIGNTIFKTNGINPARSRSAF